MSAVDVPLTVVPSVASSRTATVPQSRKCWKSQVMVEMYLSRSRKDTRGAPVGYGLDKCAVARVQVGCTMVVVSYRESSGSVGGSPKPSQPPPKLSRVEMFGASMWKVMRAWYGYCLAIALVELVEINSLGVLVKRGSRRSIVD